MSKSERRDLLKLCLGEDDGASEADSFMTACSDFEDIESTPANDSIIDDDDIAVDKENEQPLQFEDNPVAASEVAELLEDQPHTPTETTHGGREADVLSEKSQNSPPSTPPKVSLAGRRSKGSRLSTGRGRVSMSARVSTAGRPSAARRDRRSAACFAMSMDSDDDEEDCDDDAELDDIYSFDVDRVAMLLEQGADLEQITEVISQDLVESLEARVNESVAETVADSHRKSIVGTDLAGRMTPPSDEEKEPADKEDEEIPEGPKVTVVEAPASMSRASMRTSAARRSSMATRPRKSSILTRPKEMLQAADVGLNSSIQDIVEAAKARRRLSALSKNKEASAKIPEQVKEAEKLLKESEEKVKAGKATTKEDQVLMVQKAMAEARRRHRQSIAKAVNNISGAPSTMLETVQEVPDTKTNSPSPSEVSKNSIEERIKQAVQMAHKRQKGEPVQALSPQQWTSPSGYSQWDASQANWQQDSYQVQPGHDPNAYQCQQGYESMTYDSTYGYAAQTQQYADMSTAQWGGDNSGWTGHVASTPASWDATYGAQGCADTTWQQQGCADTTWQQQGCTNTSYMSSGWENPNTGYSTWASQATYYG